MEKLQRGQQVVLAGCYKDGEKTELLRQGLRETVHSLVSDHKEADSRLLLHAKHASHTHARVIIQSPDTDVAILSVAHFQSWECQELWFHTGRPLNLEALKIWSWKPKNLEIDYYLYFGGLRKKRWPFFGVEHDKNTIRVSISSKSAILICTKKSHGRDSECKRLVASDNHMDSWGSVPWPTWIYLFFVAEFVLENGLILEQRLIFGHREKR